MSAPQTASFSQFIVELGNGMSPEVFSAPCGFDTKSLDMSAASSSATVPDCTNPELPAWEVKGVNALSGKVSGSGVMATEDQALWDLWFDSGLTKNVRIRIPGIGYRVGAGILTSLGHSTALKSNANLVQRSITIDNAGPWPWTAGSPTS